MKIIKNTIAWFKALNHVVKHYKGFYDDTQDDVLHLLDKIRYLERDMKILQRDTKDAVQTIRERTNIHVDFGVHPHGYTQIITVGRYRNRDYVNVFNLDDKDFDYIIHMLKDMEKHGIVRRVDAPYPTEFVKERLNAF